MTANRTTHNTGATAMPPFKSSEPGDEPVVEFEGEVKEEEEEEEDDDDDEGEEEVVELALVEEASVVVELIDPVEIDVVPEIVPVVAFESGDVVAYPSVDTVPMSLPDVTLFGGGAVKLLYIVKRETSPNVAGPAIGSDNKSEAGLVHD